MTTPQNCAECRTIARQLWEIYAKARETPDQNDPAILMTRPAEWKSLFTVGENGGQRLPTIAPEVLDPKLRKANHPFAGLMQRKMRHQWLTGHKVKFPNQI